MLLVDAVLLSLVVFAVIGVLGLIRFGGRLLLAAVAALATWVFVPLGPGEGWLPGLVFVAVLLFFGRGRRWRRAVRGPAWPGASAAAPVSAPLGAQAARADPWGAVRRLADRGQRRRLETARLACDRYLTLAATAESESALLPIKLGRHVPALLADCAAHCASATPDEQHALVEQALASVEAVAAQAERRRREMAHDAQSRFRAIRAHLARPEE